MNLRTDFHQSAYSKMPVAVPYHTTTDRPGSTVSDRLLRFGGAKLAVFGFLTFGAAVVAMATFIALQVR